MDDPVDLAISAFWRWWPGVQEPILATVFRGMTPELIDGMSERVHAIDPRLVWEFGPGRTTPHALVLSGAGLPEVRLVAERWRAAAPASLTFEFYTTRQPVPRAGVAQQQIEMGKHTLRFADFAVRLHRDDTRRRFHLTVFHPAFPEVEPRERQHLTFLVLDNVIGEDAVERWIGTIESSDAALARTADLVDLGVLRDEVDAAPTRWPSDSHWVTARAVDPTGRPVLFALDVALQRWDHPLATTWCQVVFPYPAGANGLPISEAALAEALDLERAVLAQRGPDDVRVGHQIGDGRFVVMFYLTPAGAERIDTWVARQGRLDLEVRTAADPGWRLRPIV